MHFFRGVCIGLNPFISEYFHFKYFYSNFINETMIKKKKKSVLSLWITPLGLENVAWYVKKVKKKKNYMRIIFQAVYE